jgi:phage-related protein
MGGKVSNGIQNVSDELQSGRQVSMATETVKQQIEQRIRDYRQVTMDEIAVEFTALHTILFMMTSGRGKCVADGSQGSYRIITSVHSR